jgi:cysteinyl-tRNA synthetase
MSKSLGNFFTVKEVLARFPAEVVRFFLISSHYRSPLDFSDQALVEAETALLRLYATLARLEDLAASPPETALPAPEFTSLHLSPEETERLASLRERFSQALADDLNTAQALGYLFDAVRLSNRLLEQSGLAPPELALLTQVRRDLVELGGVLNLLQADPQAMLAALRQKPADLRLAPEEIDTLIQRRTLARKNKDWAQADAIRRQLLEAEILLEDTPQGTIWRVKV